MMHPAHFMPPTGTALNKNARKLGLNFDTASNEFSVFPSFLCRMAAFHANIRHQISHSELDLQTLYRKQLAFPYIQIGRLSYTHVNMHP